MQDLLFLAHRIPFPPVKGDKIRSFHILRHLSTRFRIHLGCFFDDARDESRIAHLQEYCSEVFCLSLGKGEKLLRGLCALVGGKSITEASYWDPRMLAWSRETIARHAIRNIFVFCSSMYPYVSGQSAGRTVLVDLVDLDSEKWAEYAGMTSWPLRELYLRERRLVFDLERRAGSDCDHCLFVSKAEADTFVRLAPELSNRVGYMENGVDLESFAPTQSFPNPFGADSVPIVFTGAMDYWPNVDAVTWFAREAFPAIRRLRGEAEFWIVGANPSSAVIRLSSSPGVRIAGAVADVRPYLAHAACVVAPLRIARGVQNKVLEAMAMAKPIVLTPAALEGLHAIPDREVLVAESATDLARRVTESIGGLWPDIGSAARARVETNYRWTENLKILDRIFPG